jgi:hypothetical protein
MDAQLIQVSKREHFLIVLIHRLATDCLGVAHALGELWELYAQSTQASSLPDVTETPSYQNYAQQQRATDAAWRQRHAAYWDEYLSGAKPVAWPPEKCAPSQAPNTTGTLASFEIYFGEATSMGLIELSQQTQTLPALVVLSLYVACLSLWCEQSDLLVPFIVAGRAAAHEGVVGCFAHIAYLRIRLSGTESFIELLKRVSSEFYRAVTFRQDCGRMAAERPGLLQGTLCQWLSWHPADVAKLQLGEQPSACGLEVKAVRCQSLEELVNAPPEMVGLEVNFFEQAGKVAALAIYRPERFSDSAVEKLMAQFRMVAEHAIRDPRAPISGCSRIG